MSNINQKEKDGFILVFILLTVFVGLAFKVGLSFKDKNYGSSKNSNIKSRQQVYQPRTTDVDMYPRRDANGEPTHGKDANGSYYR